MFLTDHYEMAAGVLVSVLLQVRNLGSWCAMPYSDATGWLTCCTEFTKEDAAKICLEDVQEFNAAFGCASQTKAKVDRMPESVQPDSQGPLRPSWEGSRPLAVESVRSQNVALK